MILINTNKMKIKGEPKVSRARLWCPSATCAGWSVPWSLESPCLSCTPSPKFVHVGTYAVQVVALGVSGGLFS